MKLITSMLAGGIDMFAYGKKGELWAEIAEQMNCGQTSCKLHYKSLLAKYKVVETTDRVENVSTI